MVDFGFHVSIAGSVDLAVDRAIELECDAFQIFSRNPRSWAFKELKEEEAEAFREKRRKSGIKHSCSHMPYILNLASPNDEVYHRSVASLIIELERCAILELPMIVTHVGSHLGEGTDMGINRVVKALDKAFESHESDKMVLLEMGPGSKNSVGSTFEELRQIIDSVSKPNRVGICFDTCHTFVSGYELRTEKGLSETLEKFDSIIGLDRICLVHLNDSVGKIASGNDHHEHIGMGQIGLKGMELIVNSKLSRVPMIMETPIDERRGDSQNMSIVRNLVKPV